jgi:hypothetical protein
MHASGSFLGIIDKLSTVEDEKYCYDALNDAPYSDVEIIGRSSETYVMHTIVVSIISVIQYYECKRDIPHVETSPANNLYTFWCCAVIG